MTEFPRRNALSLLGAGMAFLAGCSESSTDGGNGNGPDTESGSPNDGIEIDGESGALPSYASYLPESERTGYFYGAIDAETLQTLTDDEGATEGSEPTDPLIGNPVIMAILFGRIGTVASFDAYKENDDTPGGDGVLIDANGVYTIVGRYDRSGFTDDLESAGFTAETVNDDYAVYADDESGEAVGITDEVFAVTTPNPNNDAFDPISAVKRTVATAVGDRKPKYETDDDFEWLLRASSTAGMTLCRYTETETFDAGTIGSEQVNSSTLEFAFGACEGANGVHQQLSLVDGSMTATASAIVTYADESRVSMDRLKAALGTEASSVAFNRDGSTVAIDAEYDGDLVEE
ncbi:hypothetical protein [Natrinema soli]|uniref:Uncharacterized protein n=1 Tax=Natrinema soli TaxID=1930624 RepID=A0ABD5T094_9EURY|nr:hypothetical protein [Natrinema soli]